MSQWSRREFVRRGGLAALAASLPPMGLGSWSDGRWTMHAIGDPRYEGGHSIHDPRVNDFAMAAIDAARRAGAEYADVRLTYTRIRNCSELFEQESLGIGVRALVHGYWGFASGPYWSTDGAVRAGRESVAQAKVNALGAPRTVELGPPPSAKRGDWITPVEIDPFEVPVEEVCDWMKGNVGYATPIIIAKDRSGFAQAGVTFTKQELAFASTDGAYLTQTFFTTQSSFGIRYRDVGESYPDLGIAGTGWETVTRADVREWLPKAMAAIDEDLTIPLKPLEIGRYDAVFSAAAMATLLNGTIAPATQLDRALGTEANATGTSYLGPNPSDFLGTPVCSRLVTITADRSTPGALATVKWDDEGVEPQPFTIIKDGTLVDYQTMREQATWLSAWYGTQRMPMRSHGCARAPSALDVTMQHTPNIAMAPGAADVSFTDLYEALEEGIAVRGINVEMDQQNLSGLGFLGGMYEIKKGKRVSRCGGPGSATGFLFRAPELWKNITAIGGARSFMRYPMGMSVKGEPSQAVRYSVGAVPSAIKNVALVDVRRGR